MSVPQAAHSNHSLKAEDYAAQLKNCRDLVLQAMKAAQEAQNRYFDRKYSPLMFLLGELARFTRSGTFRRETKLSPTAEVVRIVEMVSPGAYRIQTLPGSRMHDVVSIEHLRKYTARDPGEEPTGVETKPTDL